jgi:hypothetical protein
LIEFFLNLLEDISSIKFFNVQSSCQGMGVDMFLWVLKTKSNDDLEFVHDAVQGVVDSSTTKVKKPKVLPKTTPKPVTIVEVLPKVMVSSSDLPNLTLAPQWQW